MVARKVKYLVEKLVQHLAVLMVVGSDYLMVDWWVDLMGNYLADTMVG